MSYVLARHEPGGWLYWSGSHDRSGLPRTTTRVGEAYHFSGYASALECAETHDCFRASEVWHVRKLREIGGKS